MQKINKDSGKVNFHMTLISQEVAGFLAFQIIRPILTAKRARITIHKASLMQMFRLIIWVVFLSANLALRFIYWLS